MRQRTRERDRHRKGEAEEEIIRTVKKVKPLEETIIGGTHWRAELDR